MSELDPICGTKRAVHFAVAQPAVIHGLAAPRVGRADLRARRSISERELLLAEALAGQFDAIGVVNDAARMAAATVGTPIRSCQRSAGTWLAMLIEP